ncbi:MAG TPA: glycosyltransferase family 4 protein [Syntrophomonadaceae bacterium]|nr:glycosyltransferase family 4 protein [Syntrophomonadaceae bacterium]
MKKVLIITYYYPPDGAIGGVRPFGIAKNIVKYGWEPIIITESDGQVNGKNITSYTTEKISNMSFKASNVSSKVTDFVSRSSLCSNHDSKIYKFLRGFYDLVNYPDPQYNWYAPAVELGSKIIEENQINVILSTSKPETCHLVAKKLHEKYNIPWVADFRDLWSDNHYIYHNKLIKLLQLRLEKKTISKASTITTVSVPLKKELESIHKSGKVYSITNGFDVDNVLLAEMAPKVEEKFSILYTGNLYKGKRDPEMLFQSVSSLINDGILPKRSIKIDFYGNDNKWLTAMVGRYDLNEIVTLHGYIPRKEAIKRQQTAQLLLLLTWDDIKDNGVYTGKLFDYLAARRPILCIGSKESVVAELLSDTKAGICVSSVSEMSCVLEKYYNEYKNSKVIPYRGLETEIGKYSQAEMAKKFAKIFDDLSKKTTCRNPSVE